MENFITAVRSALVLLAFFASWTHAAPIVMDEIAAIVDDDIIARSEIENRLATIKAQAANPASLPPDNALREQIIERLIVEKLQLQVARRAGIRVSDSELNDAMRRIAEQNQLTLDQFRQAIEQDGLSYNDMRRQVEQEIMIGRVQQGVMNSRIEISTNEIDDFLATEAGQELTADEFRVGHILIPFKGGTSSNSVNAAKAEADAIIEALATGSNFQSLAMEKSAGSNALEGGDLGWRKPSALPTLFADIAVDMSVEEVKGPIRSSSGFHIIKMIQRRGATAEGLIDQTRVRHVLIKPNEIRSLEEARQLAEDLRGEIVAGRDFGEVARLYSEDPGSALSGGDLGWNTGREFVPAFASMMRGTEEGVVSPVFQSDFGFHFLEVTGKRVEDFSDMFKRNQVENYLRNQSFEEEVDNWVREIREDAFVEIRS